VVAKYEGTLAKRQQWTTRLQMSAEALEPDMPSSQAKTPFTIEWTYYKDHERAAVRTVRTEKGKIIGAYMGLIDGWFVMYTLPPPGRDALAAQFGEDGAKRRGSAVPQALPAMEGFVAGDYAGLVQILRSAGNVTSSREIVDGHECVVVRAVSDDYGDYRVWFDPRFDTDGIGRRLSLELGAPPAEVFIPHIRAGAKLSNLENPQIPFCWRDGKAVPLIDQATLNHMDKTADLLRGQIVRSGEGSK
jgi:hypothetical protein